MLRSALSAQSDGDRGLPARVVIAEDSYLLREALAQVLSRTDAVDVVGICEDRDGLWTAITEGAPDAVLTDIRMPPTGTDEGIQIARALRETHPKIGVVVLSQFVDPSYVLALLEHGSARRGYLLKERLGSPEHVITAIRAVVAGGSFIDPTVVQVLVQARSRSARSSLSELTPRERDVLSEIAQAKSNAAIADSLSLTKRAVEKHVRTIFMKLQLGNADEVDRRVKAALMFLAADEG